jgi:hypothetical protein
MGFVTKLEVVEREGRYKDNPLPVVLKVLWLELLDLLCCQLFPQPLQAPEDACDEALAYISTCLIEELVNGENKHAWNILHQVSNMGSWPDGVVDVEPLEQ